MSDASDKTGESLHELSHRQSAIADRQLPIINLQILQFSIDIADLTTGDG
jgi:hypothetical protein